MLAYQYLKSYGMHTVVARISAGHAKSECTFHFVRRCTWLEHHPEQSAIRVEILRRNGLSWTSAVSIGR